ncbi:MAG: hypothetical protein CSA62_00975 [Planctomycetota bacterium]|nr:MAG: hypothetical protein CSA62_00975 [Planctomycetota bacterium]
MQNFFSGASEERARATARFVAIVLLLLFLWQALSRLFLAGDAVVRLSDDAFYQFELASNLAEGLGLSVDGLHLAHGVQLLWPLLLTPFAFVLGSAALPFVATLLGLFFLLLATYLAVRLLDRHVPFELAVALGLFLLSRPGVIDFATNGQETCLVLVGLFAWALLSLSPPNPAGQRPVLPELAMALVLPWLRTELIALPLGLALWYLLAQIRGLERNRWQRPLMVGLAGLVSYLLLQLLFFAAALPPSGFAIPEAMQGSFWAGNPSMSEILERYWFFGRPLALGGVYGAASLAFGATAAWMVLAPLLRIRRWLPLVLVLALSLLGAGNSSVALLGALLLLVAPNLPGQLWRSSLLPGFVGGWLAFFAVACLHLLLRQYPRDYYFVLAALPGLLGLAFVLGYLFKGEGLLALVPETRRRQLGWMLLLLLAVFDFGHSSRSFPWQQENDFAARMTPLLFEEGLQLQPPAVAGFNSGILAWAYPGPVINLDGVVDGAVLPFARQRRIAAWLRELGVAFVIDSPRQLYDEDRDRFFPHASGKRLGAKGFAELEPLVVFDLPGVTGEHRGTDVQLLLKVPGLAAAKIKRQPRILGEYRGQKVALLPAEFFGAQPLVVDDGRTQRILSAPLSNAAGLYVLPLPIPSGKLMQGQKTLFHW